MIQAGDGLGFALEALFADGVCGKLRGKNLDGHGALERTSRARYTSPMPPEPSGDTIS
jgi:hypothetical protein